MTREWILEMLAELDICRDGLTKALECLTSDPGAALKQVEGMAPHVVTVESHHDVILNMMRLEQKQ